jgi:uncharacterized protein HemX
MNPVETIWQAVQRLGPITVIAVVVVLALVSAIFLLLKHLLKQNEITTAERQTITTQFLSSLETTGVETVGAIRKSAEVMDRLCVNAEANQKNVLSFLEMMQTAIISNQKNIMASLDLSIREHGIFMDMLGMINKMRITRARKKAAKSGG